MIPKVAGEMCNCSTRYIGKTLATISDETSVKKLVKPSAQTVGLTAGRMRDFAGAPVSAGDGCFLRRLAQSIAYIAIPHEQASVQLRVREPQVSRGKSAAGCRSQPAGRTKSVNALSAMVCAP